MARTYVIGDRPYLPSPPLGVSGKVKIAAVLYTRGSYAIPTAERFQRTLNKVERYSHPNPIIPEVLFQKIQAEMHQRYARNGQAIDKVAFADFPAFIEGEPQHPSLRDEHGMPQHEILASRR